MLMYLRSLLLCTLAPSGIGQGYVDLGIVASGNLASGKAAAALALERRLSRSLAAVVNAQIGVTWPTAEPYWQALAGLRWRW